MAARGDDRQRDEVDELRRTLTDINDLLHELSEARAGDVVRAEALKDAVAELRRVVIGVDGGNGLSHRVTRNEGRLDTIEARDKDAGRALADPRTPAGAAAVAREPTEQQALAREREIDAAVGGWAVRTIRRHGIKILAGGGGAGLVLERIAHYFGWLDKH